MPYVVCATYLARVGHEDRVAEIIEAMSAPSRAEPGCLHYQAHRSREDARRFLIYETYLDEEAYVAHQTTPHFQRLIRDEAVALLDARERSFYEPFG